MAKSPQLLDHRGNPVQRSELVTEVSAAEFGSVRSPVTSYPGDGLNPLRLGAILREADLGLPMRYLELAETIEERDPHYQGVLGTRRRSVSQVAVTVEDGGDTPNDQKMADVVRDWLKRDELADEVFNILDAIGKGYSHTEIIWDTSMGQWMPKMLEWRDPRWFRFQKGNLSVPVMLGTNGEELPYPAFKFIFARISAKSGLPLRSGLARVAMWTYLFKKYTERDWAIFAQTYGQPIRIGKYGAGSSKEDRNTLFAAVANIAGDCAAIIPQSMEMDFVQAKDVGSGSDLYLKRADWLDKQISKAVLGQTSTTDAETGGLGSGKEHREVQQDIETADCRALAAILNRDLIRPWIDLEFGPQKRYPRLVIARPEAEDLAQFSSAVTPFIDRGLKVRSAEVLSKFGLSEPEDNDEILRPIRKSTSPADTEDGSDDENDPESAVKYPFNTREGQKRPEVAKQSQGGSGGRTAPSVLMADRLAIDAAPQMEAMLVNIEAALQSAGTLAEAREMLMSAYPDIDEAGLTLAFANAFFAADAGGRATVEVEGDG